MVEVLAANQRGRAYASGGNQDAPYTALAYGGPVVPKQKRRFQVEIEADVLVQAFDEASARKKAERALSTARSLDGDVHATGVVWTYAVTPQSSEDA